MKEKQISLLWYVSAALIALNIILYIIKPGTEKTLAIIGDTFPVICSLIAAWSLYHTFRAFKSKDYTRTAWMMIFIGVLLDFIAEVLYGGQEVLLGIDMNSLNKSVADIFWIIGYPFTLAGMIILANGYVKTDFPKGKPAIYIGMIALLMVVVIVVVQYLLRSIIIDPDTSLIDKAVYMFYPVADIVVVSISVVIFYFTGQFGSNLISSPWRTMAIAWAIMGISDILFSYYSWKDTYSAGSMIDVGWNLGYLLLALSGLYQRRLIEKVSGGK